MVKASIFEVNFIVLTRIKKRWNLHNPTFLSKKQKKLVLFAEITIFATEFINTTSGVNQFHLTGEEWV